MSVEKKMPYSLGTFLWKTKLRHYQPFGLTGHERIVFDIGQNHPQISQKWTYMKKTKSFLIIASILVLFTFGQEPKPNNNNSTTFTPVTVYDPARDAAQDILDAQAEAKRTGKNVLVEVGGDWCSWCRIMHHFYRDHPELLALREKNFVTVQVNMSRQNENKKLLAKYPEIRGYPHIFILDADGKLLHSQNTSDLEDGPSYNLKQFMKFLEKWVPKA